MKRDGFHQVLVRSCSAKKDCHGTSFEKDVTEVLQRQLEYAGKRTLCSARIQETQYQQFFINFDYGLNSNMIQRSEEEGNGIAPQSECVK